MDVSMPDVPGPFEQPAAKSRSVARERYLIIGPPVKVLKHLGRSGQIKYYYTLIGGVMLRGSLEFPRNCSHFPPFLAPSSLPCRHGAQGCPILQLWSMCNAGTEIVEKEEAVPHRRILEATT